MPQFNRIPHELAAVSGIYIHIPFCRKACHYCDFHFSTSRAAAGQMVESLAREILLRGRVWPEQPRTLYFGGGTPSLLTRDQLQQLFRALQDVWGTVPWEEVTLEANPEDLSPEALSAWRDLGVTRLSIGIQSLQDDTLQWMNRAHTAREALDGVERAHRAGFPHLSIDLIYSLPEPHHLHWAQDLRRALDLPIDHLSAYLLTVEPRTVLGHRVERGDTLPLPDDRTVEQYALLRESTEQAGFQHYEVSNFARPGGHARHNSRYWDGTPYLGIGPGAHSFDGQRRLAQPGNNPRYIRTLRAAADADAIPLETEVLTSTDRYNETLMTGLRTAAGIDLRGLAHRFGCRPDTDLPRDWERLLAAGILSPTGTPDSYRISPAHWLLGDTVAATFFRTD